MRKIKTRPATAMQKLLLLVNPQDTSKDALQESPKIGGAQNLRGLSLVELRTPKS